jgi:adenylate cyclase
MAAIHLQNFSGVAEFRVGDVTLSAGDDLQTQRNKLARIMFDAMYQFVGLLDTDGTMLEINHAALEAAGIRMDDIRGKPFWEARWWGVSGQTQALLRELIHRAGEGEFVRCDFEVYGQLAGAETIVVDFRYCRSKIQTVRSSSCFLRAAISLRKNAPKPRSGVRTRNCRRAGS